MRSKRYISVKQPIENIPTTNDVLKKALQKPAGPLYNRKISTVGTTDGATLIRPESSEFFIP